MRACVRTCMCVCVREKGNHSYKIKLCLTKERTIKLTALGPKISSTPESTVQENGKEYRQTHIPEDECTPPNQLQNEKEKNDSRSPPRATICFFLLLLLLFFFFLNTRALQSNLFVEKWMKVSKPQSFPPLTVLRSATPTSVDLQVSAATANNEHAPQTTIVLVYRQTYLFLCLWV